MEVKQIIRSTKTNIEVSEWRQGNITRSQFPLSKTKNQKYKYGSDYSWRVIKFCVDGQACRILIIFSPAKEIFSCTLAVEVGEDMRVLCVHEYHAAHRHPGWHCHVTTEDHLSVMPGLWRGRLRRWPAASVPHARRAFGVRRETAMDYVRDLFHIREDEAQGRLL
jgi:hypothetical protein